MDASRTRPPCSERWRLASASAPTITERAGVGSQLELAPAIDASASATRRRSHIPLFSHSAEPACGTSPREASDTTISMCRARSACGISVENVAYSPDSVADYTLMLMLMAVRDAKSTISRAQVARLPTARASAEENSAT